MSLGSWDPTADAAAAQQDIDDSLLRRFIGYSRDGQLEALPTLISGDESQVLAGLMQLDQAHWQRAVAGCSDDELLHLIRFFAVAENLPGWEAGAQSPVIPLARSLRQRGQRLDRELLQWLREVNQNRFLPYGPL